MTKQDIPCFECENAPIFNTTFSKLCLSPLITNMCAMPLFAYHKHVNVLNNSFKNQLTQKFIRKPLRSHVMCLIWNVPILNYYLYQFSMQNKTLRLKYHCTSFMIYSPTCSY